MPLTACHGLLLLVAAADCDGEERWEERETTKPEKSRLHCEGEDREEDAKPAPVRNPAIKRQGFGLLTRWDSLADTDAAAMLCLVSPSSSPTPLPPPRRSRSPADRAAPPGIAVSCGDPRGLMDLLCFFLVCTDG